MNTKFLLSLAVAMTAYSLYSAMLTGDENNFWKLVFELTDREDNLGYLPRYNELRSTAADENQLSRLDWTFIRGNRDYLGAITWATEYIGLTRNKLDKTDLMKYENAVKGIIRKRENRGNQAGGIDEAHQRVLTRWELTLNKIKEYVEEHPKDDDNFSTVVRNRPGLHSSSTETKSQSSEPATMTAAQKKNAAKARARAKRREEQQKKRKSPRRSQEKSHSRSGSPTEKGGRRNGGSPNGSNRVPQT